MKALIALLLSGIVAFGQGSFGGPGLPFFANPTSAPSVFDPTNYPNLFVELLSDDSKSLAIPNTNNAPLVFWTNIAPVSFANNGFVDFFHGTAPTYNTNGNALGGPCADFTSYTGWGFNGAKSTFTNQPVTCFVVAQSSAAANQTLFDGFDSFGDLGRLLLRSTTSGSLMYAGSTVSATHTQLTNWIVWSAVYNSNGPAYWRTNGVLCGSGSPGTPYWGHPMIANDQTATTPFKGKYCAFLAYGTQFNTNDLQTIEAALKSRFGVP
jgi:hypothetical protein